MRRIISDIFSLQRILGVRGDNHICNKEGYLYLALSMFSVVIVECEVCCGIERPVRIRLDGFDISC